MYWLIIILILIIILMMPIKVRIIYNDQKNDVDLYLTKLFNYHIDIDEFIKYILSSKENRKVVTLESAVNNIIIFYRLRGFYYCVAKMTKITKTTILCKIKNDDNYQQIVFSWIGMSVVKKMLMTYFGYVNNELYNVHLKTIKNEVDFEIVFRFRLVYIIISFFKNIKTIIHIMKITKKGSEKENA